MPICGSGRSRSAHYLKLSPADRVLGVLPLSFDYGQNQLFSTWAAGASVAPLDYLTARDVIKAVDAGRGDDARRRAAALGRSCSRREWPAETAARLKRLTNSGGALTPAMIQALRQRFPQADLYPMYGLTEAFRSTYLVARPGRCPSRWRSGVPSLAEVMAVRADGSRAAAGEPGELVHAGPLVAQGYWRDAERTGAAFPAARRTGPSMTAWRSGPAIR